MGVTGAGKSYNNNNFFLQMHELHSGFFFSKQHGRFYSTKDINKIEGILSYRTCFLHSV